MRSDGMDRGSIDAEGWREQQACASRKGGYALV
jgi:hypothetical protein